MFWSVSTIFLFMIHEQPDRCSPIMSNVHKPGKIMFLIVFLHILSDDNYISTCREIRVSYCFLHVLSDDNCILTGRERKSNRQVRLPNPSARLEAGSQTLETHEL